MKKIISISVSILFAVIINAQTHIIGGIEGERIKEENLSRGMLKNEEYFEKADYILEVKWFSDTVERDYYSSRRDTLTKNDIYTYRTLHVLYVYKGNNVHIGDTIVAFKKGGKIVKEVTHPDYPDMVYYETIGIGYGPMDDQGIEISGDYPTIIFGFNSEFPACFDASKNDKYLKMEIQNKERAALKLRSKITGLNDLFFKDRYELYEYMEQFKGLNIPKVPQGNMTN